MVIFTSSESSSFGIPDEQDEESSTSFLLTLSAIPSLELVGKLLEGAVLDANFVVIVISIPVFISTATTFGIKISSVNPPKAMKIAATAITYCIVGFGVTTIRGIPTRNVWKKFIIPNEMYVVSLLTVSSFRAIKQTIFPMKQNTNIIPKTDRAAGLLYAL